MDESLTALTGIGEHDRKKVLSWLATLPEAQILAIFQSGVKLSFQFKNAESDLPGRAMKYAALVVAARKAGWDTVRGKGYRVASQRQFDDFSHLRKSKAAELMKKGRRPVLKKKVLAHWGEIVELKNEGAGFRAVANYLAKERRLKVSASYLAKLWDEIEND